MMEGYSQKLAGTGNGTNASSLMGDVKMPANLNDTDLFPGMKELPEESDRATEMMFFLIRCHVGEFLKRFESPKATFDGAWNKLTTSAVDVDTKEKAIGELECLFEHKFLRHCDSSIIWHFMCTHLAKAIIFMMRFMAYGANYQGKTESQADKDVLFTLSLQVCASQNLAYTMKEMQGFMWHVNMHFQWKAFVYVLSELRYRTSGPEVDQAWKDIRLTYQFHPGFGKELSRRALPIAVSNLTLKAWEAYTTANATLDSDEPDFIQLIRSRQQESNPKQSNVASEPLNALTADPAPPYTPSFFQGPVAGDSLSVYQPTVFDWNAADLNASLGMPAVLTDLAPLDYPEEMDWSTWNHLLVDFQTNDGNMFSLDMPSLNLEL